jgi:hypothetical protein
MRNSLIVFLVISIISCGVMWYNLDTTKNELLVATTQLEIAQNQLTITNNELVNTRTQLVNTEFKLDSTQNKLTNTEAELQNTTSQLTSIKNQLTDTKFQLSTVQTQLKTTQNEKTQMLTQYSGLIEQINSKLGQGENSEKYITPDNVSVSAKAKEITGGYSEDNNERWRDYKQLYDWVVKNTKYNDDTYLPILPSNISGKIVWVQEFWRMPEETLEDKAGDCEDMAILLASMMLSYNNEKYSIWVLGIKNEDSAHLGVAYPVAGYNLVILDPAGNYYTGENGGYLRSFDINRAVSDWLAHWSREMPGAHINKVFSNKLYKEFSSTEEFINWAKD